MTDIAARAGVSRAAVSHVLNGYQNKSVRISEATRGRILETAREMGYRPNQLARSVASGKTNMIGYLVMEPDYEPYWKTIIGALFEAETLGYTLKVFSVTNETLEERVRQCIELRLSGLIVRVIADKSRLFEEAGNAQIPVVTVDEGSAQPFGAHVASDDSVGFSAAIEHLIGFGHSRIGFITSGFPRINAGNGDSGDIGTARERLFLAEMEARGLDVPAGYIVGEMMSVFGPFPINGQNRESAIRATQALLDHPAGRPTAICCWRDETAMVAIGACQQRGLRVPEDISVIGFSDLSNSRFFNPPLSTIKSPWNAMGRMAVQQILARQAEDFGPEPSTHLLDSLFVARDSTAAAP